jgi:hypothetical protein
MVKSAFVTLILCLPQLAGCDDANESDCNARVRYEDTIFRPHNELRESPPRGRLLAAGDVIDCGGRAIDQVKVYAVKGVDPEIAVMARGTWRGVYVAEGLRPSMWPAPPRSAGVGSTLTTTGTASRPARPPRSTMRTVRRTMLAQRFRPYSGPLPPPISKAEALQRGRYPHDYSLGLWDVGIVHEGPTYVRWRSVWIIATERYYRDLSELSLGGPVQPDAPPEPSEPGWVRYLTLFDARTGRFVSEYQF